MYNHILEEKEFAHKKNKMTTVIRVVHNKENPYVQLSRESLWDANLSLRAIGLWSRCMSRKNDWTFHLNEMIKGCKEGRDAVQAAMNELIENRYVARIEYHHRVKGRFVGGGVQYIFFEYKATEEEIEEQLEIFKKSFQQQDFQETGNQVPENPHLIRIDIKKRKISKEKQSSLKVSSDQEKEACASMPDKSGEKRRKVQIEDYPEEVYETGRQMIKAMKEVKPDCKEPPERQFLDSIDLMMRIDKRSPEKIMRIFRWALADSFWADKFFKPNPAKYLREKFDQLDTKMNAKPQERPRTFAAYSSAEKLNAMAEETEREMDYWRED